MMDQTQLIKTQVLTF